MIWRIIQIAEDEIIHQALDAEVDRDNILLVYNSSHTNFCRGGSVFFFLRGSTSFSFKFFLQGGGQKKLSANVNKEMYRDNPFSKDYIIIRWYLRLS